MSRVLVAGMGNLLRKDDGFGVEVVRRLARRDGLPSGVEIMDVGIGGIHLVHQLMNGYDALVLVDAMEGDGPPGSLRLLEVEVTDLASWPEEERRDFLADMHYSTPSKALILARALGVLPPRVLLLGCRPADVSDLGIGLTESVHGATTGAVLEIERLLSPLLETTIDLARGS